MTTENLIELFEKGVGCGSSFTTNIPHLMGRGMEFYFTVQEKNTTPSHTWKSLGRIYIVCELSPEDYINGDINKAPFGVTYYIKYDTNIEGVKAFKFIIDSEIFSRLIRLFRVKEREEAAIKDIKKVEDFKKRMDTIENQYAIEVTALTRNVITEKKNSIYMSALDEFTIIVRPEDISILKEPLEFEVHLAENRSFVPPIKISFVCQKITHEHDDGTIAPCCFSTEIPEEDVKKEPGSMEINFGKTVIKTVNKFLTAIVDPNKNQGELDYIHKLKLNVEGIKSLTNVFERQVLTEKHRKRRIKPLKVDIRFTI